MVPTALSRARRKGLPRAIRLAWPYVSRGRITKLAARPRKARCSPGPNAWGGAVGAARGQAGWTESEADST
eukprot:4665875-Prymnesium_polylepis.1